MNNPPTVFRALIAVAASVLATASPAAAELAATPWPMFQHDARHTGQSAYLGPLAPSHVTTWPGFDRIKSSPTIGTDGTIYVTLGWYLCAINPDMTQKWCTKLRADISTGSPAVGGDGTIYLGDRDNTLTAFDPVDGHKKWLYNNGFEGDILNSPAIGSDGTIYFVFGQNRDGVGLVTALDSNGLRKWKYAIGTVVETSSPAIDQNGFIYVGDVKGTLHKFQNNPASPKVWSKLLGGKITGSPVIGDDGTIYIGSTSGLFAVRADGQLLWSFPTPGWVDQAPAIGLDGTLYFGTMAGQSKMLYAVGPDGAIRWQWGPLVVSTGFGGFPIVGGDGVIYFAVGFGVYAFSPDGVPLWNYLTTGGVWNAPTIAGAATKLDGGTAVLYLGSGDWRLYAISGDRHGEVGNNPPTAVAGPDRTAKVGQPVSFSAAGSGDIDGDVVSYRWDFGDGKKAIGPQVTHAYLQANPQYTTTLTVSDGLVTSTDTVAVEIDPTNGPLTFGDDFHDPATLTSDWQVYGQLVITGGELRSGLAKGNHIGVVPAMSGLDQSASASFASVDNNQSPRLGIVLRFLDAQNYYVFYRQLGGTNALRISRVTNGVETVLASVSAASAALNTFFRIDADATADHLTLKLDGVLKLSAKDAKLAGGSVGVLLGTGLSSTKQYRADNFSAMIP